MKSDNSAALAVLISGGLDSAVLLGESLHHYDKIFPLFVRMGLYWEETELHFLRRFLHELHSSALQPLTILDMPVADVYGSHWSLNGCDVPDADTQDEAVYLPGRNVLLLSKALLWCHLHDVPHVALGSLSSNPFPDATPAFFVSFQQVVNQAIGGHVEIVRPYAGLHKIDVLQRGRGLPLEWTFSCIQPVAGRHCGQCNKCAERQRGFAEAKVVDPTVYGKG